jgi:hypothetical protein
MNYGLVLTARARADILRSAEWWAGNHLRDQAIAIFNSIYTHPQLFFNPISRWAIAKWHSL